MKRISNQVRQRRRQAWLDLPAHEIEEVGHGLGRATVDGGGAEAAPQAQEDSGKGRCLGRRKIYG